MTIIAAAGTGFLGKALVERLLQNGHTVVVLTRDPGKVALKHPSLHVRRWDAHTVDAWAESIENADAIVNLTGELIAGKRWTTMQKDIILKTRIDSTRALVSAIERARKKPSVLINISGVGFYGDVPSGDVAESSRKGSDFLANLCDRWEGEAGEARKFGVRVVTPRLGLVLGTDGGALPRLMLPFKLFGGGYLGSGRQWFPWIHRNDVISVIEYLLKEHSLSGPVNCAAPEPVTMKEFCRTLGSVMRRPSWTAVPSFMLRLMLGEMSEMLLTGQRVVPKRLQDAGFIFEYATLRFALADLVKRSS